MVFDGTNYGLLGYHAEFALQNFEIEWSGEITDFLSNRIFGVNSQEAATNNSGIFEILAGGFVNVLRWQISSIADNDETHPLTDSLLNKNIVINVKKFGTTCEWTIDGVLHSFTLSDTIWYDNTDAETILGARWNGSVAESPFIGTMRYWRLWASDGLGNRTSYLIDIFAGNNNGVTVPNTATNAPSGSDFIWNTI
jgi:hypothetical protein